MNPTSLLNGLGAAITADPALGGASSRTAAVRLDRRRVPRPGPGPLGLLDPDGRGGDARAGPATGQASGQPSAVRLAWTGRRTGCRHQVAGQADRRSTTPTDTDADAADTDPADATAGRRRRCRRSWPSRALAGDGRGPRVPASRSRRSTAPTTAPARRPTDAADRAAAVGRPTAEPSAPAGRPRHRPPSTRRGPRHRACTDARSRAVTPVDAVAAPASGSGRAAPVADRHLVAVTHQVDRPGVPGGGARGPAAPRARSRVTVKLNPESLGEVRVVLTSRRGGLEVSLAARQGRPRALTDGAPELQPAARVASAATDSRIVVRDLPDRDRPGTTVSTHRARSRVQRLRTCPTDWPAGRHRNRTARRRPTRGPGAAPAPAPGSTNATDGTPSATNPSRPTESVTRAHAGLDVTM